MTCKPPPAPGRTPSNGKTTTNARAGIEATISQAITITGCRRTRYRGLAKTHLHHIYCAVALNLRRLDAYWNDTPTDRTRTSHLARLNLSLQPAA